MGAPFWSFVAVTFIFTWALLPWAAHSISVSLLALCGPAVAASVVVACGDAVTRREFWQRLIEWRIAFRWYGLALLLPVMISAVRTGLEYMLGARGSVELQHVSMLGAAVFVLVAGEEIGWRGYAQPLLERRLGPWQAAVVVGIIWAVWHLPLFFMPTMPQFGSPFVAFAIYTVALSVILMRFSLSTRQSVLVATVFHGAVNTLGLVNTAASPALRGWGNAACYGLAALVLVAVEARRQTRPCGN